MVFTRSSKSQSRNVSLKRKCINDSDVPRKRSRRRSQSLNNRKLNLKKTRSDKISKSTPVTPLKTLLSTNDRRLQKYKMNKSETSGDLKYKFAIGESEEITDFFDAEVYQKYLPTRCRGNLVYQRAAKEIDFRSMNHMSDIIDDARTKTFCRHPLLQALNILARNELETQMEFESNLSHMSLTRKSIANNYKRNYGRLKDEVWEDLHLRSNRLRPRERKVDYAVRKKYQKLRLKSLDTKKFVESDSLTALRKKSNSKLNKGTSHVQVSISNQGNVISTDVSNSTAELAESLSTDTVLVMGQSEDISTNDASAAVSASNLMKEVSKSSGSEELVAENVKIENLDPVEADKNFVDIKNEEREASNLEQIERISEQPLEVCTDNHIGFPSDNQITHSLVEVEIQSSCNCGKCYTCIIDDGETEGCEISDFEIEFDDERAVSKKKIRKSKEIPTKRRRRIDDKARENWKFCYGSNREKGKRKSKPDITGKKGTSSSGSSKHKKILYIEPSLSNSDSDCSDIEIDYPPTTDQEKNAKSVKKSNWDTKLPPEYLDNCVTPYFHQALEPPEDKSSTVSKTTEPCSGTSTCKSLVVIEKKEVEEDDRKQSPCLEDQKQDNSDGKELPESVTVLKECLKAVVTDESKYTIKTSPLVAELTEVDYEQFYHLVLVLQGTNFIVKSAAMQNVRGPGDKILQLYNCTVCLKDEIDEATDQTSPEKSEQTFSRKNDEIFNDSNCSDYDKQMSKPKRNPLCRRAGRTKHTKKSHPYLVPGMAYMAANAYKRKRNSRNREMENNKPRTILPKSQLSISPVSMTKFSESEFACGRPKMSGRVLVKATCIKKRTYSDDENDDVNSLMLDPDLRDRIISDVTQVGHNQMFESRGRGLREAQKRIGRRKTDPDIHPITRRLNRKTNRKLELGLQFGLENRPLGVKRPSTVPDHPQKFLLSTKSPMPQIAEVPITTVVSAVLSSTPTNVKTYNFVNRNELRNFGSPEKVQLDNKGRFVDPYKPLERHQETPATALTASELLKLQKIDGPKPDHNDENISPTSKVRQHESGEESDFELGDSSQGFKILQARAKGSSHDDLAAIPFIPVSSTGALKAIIANSDSIDQSFSLSAKPFFKDAFGFRKILPRPKSTYVPEELNSKALFQRGSHRPQEVSVVTVSNIDSQSIDNIKRCPVAEQNCQLSISPVKQQDRDMSFLKSLLNKASVSNIQRALVLAEKDSQKVANSNSQNSTHSDSDPKKSLPQPSASTTYSSSPRCRTTGSLRVPPASFYTSMSINSQTPTTVVPMKPITVSVTRHTAEDVHGITGNSATN